LWWEISAQRIKGTLGINRLIKFESSYRITWFGTSIVGSSHPGREGASKGWAVRPIKAERRAGFRTSWDSSVPIYCLNFKKKIFSCFWYERNKPALSLNLSFAVSHATFGSGLQFLGLICLELICYQINFNFWNSF